MTNKIFQSFFSFILAIKTTLVPVLACKSSKVLLHPDPLEEPDGGQSLLEKPPSEEGEDMLL